MCAALVAGASGRCSLFGRHHIHTFDGVLYEFPGDCSYLLAGDCKHRTFILLGESPRWWFMIWNVSAYLISHGVSPCCEIDARRGHSMHVFWRNLPPIIFFSPPFATSDYCCLLKLLNVSFKCITHRWFGWWQKNWSHFVSGGRIWTPPVCRRPALTRR